jgi:hypothetical protein
VGKTERSVERFGNRTFRPLLQTNIVLGSRFRDGCPEFFFVVVVVAFLSPSVKIPACRICLEEGRDVKSPREY